jgi:chromate transport protein ChrA
MYAICIPATSLLFFFRVRAVFSRSKYVVWFFSFMWLAVLGAAFTTPQALFATRIGPTKYCTTGTLKPFAVVCVIVPLVNDTLVLLAVTVGLATNTHLEPTLKQGIRTVMYGDYLPAFSRAMLRDNQMYYM